MEFCESGNLETLLRVHDARFVSEPIARRYLRQLHRSPYLLKLVYGLIHVFFASILSGVEYMHLSGIAHRNLCVQNILVTNDNTVKICDFSQAVSYTPGDPFCTDVVGTPGYQAGEDTNDDFFMNTAAAVQLLFFLRDL
ncbi:sperm motility kinase x [Plakobranchus ocellatus]|uniref:Sperm motility kinase x n=1 Tax=Plakobranchus ocellatus TaxID=259542 RepID=A0AAV4A5I6_9GAST|nr:sperm motility kinase x [Plakobranchus ocellatus]